MPPHRVHFLAIVAGLRLLPACGPTAPTVTAAIPGTVFSSYTAVPSQKVPIGWTIAGGTAPYTVSLSVRYDDGGSFKPISAAIAQAAAGGGSFDWFPPNRPNDTAELEVKVTDGASLVGVGRVTFELETHPDLAKTTTLRDFDQPGTQPLAHGRDLSDPGSCSTCHNQDSPANGFPTPDVLKVIPGVAKANLMDNWSGTMMALASLDPLFDACLEIANQDFPESGDLCIRCHAAKAWVNGRSSPTDFSLALPQGQHAFSDDKVGVSCEHCHRLVDRDTAQSFTKPLDDAVLAHLGAGNTPTHYANGMYVIDPDHPVVPDAGYDPGQTGGMPNPVPPRRRGPFAIPADVQDGNHRMLESRFHTASAMCGTCHDVSNPALEKVGASYVPGPLDAPATDFSPGKLMPIERTYSEWQASSFAAGGAQLDAFDMGAPVQSCQDCHMRNVRAAACNLAGPDRDDFPYHDLTGGNVWIPTVLKGEYFANDTGMQAALDDTVRRTRYMLQNSATVDLDEIAGGPPKLRVRITNETGHKLPTGYPEGRRMWLNVRFLDAGGQLLKESNRYNLQTGYLDKSDAESKVYEAKLGVDVPPGVTFPLPPDVQNGQETFHFVVNNKVMKDNRIPPRGFTNAAFAAFGGAPVGAAYADGQYHDDSLYAVPPCATKAEVTLYYQTASREYIEFLRDKNKGTAQGTGAGLRLYDMWRRYAKGPPEPAGRSAGVCTLTASDTPAPGPTACTIADGCPAGQYCKGGTGTHSVTLTLNQPGATAAPALCRASSRKTHGGQGDFDVAVSLGHSESRAGGPTKLVVQFDQPLDGSVVGTVSVLPGPQNGTATIGTTTVAGSSVVVNLSGATDQRCLKLRLSGFQGANCQPIPDLDIPIKVLLGDNSEVGNGAVAVSRDVEETQEFSGLLVDGSLFRYDVNTSGNVSAADIAQTFAQVGHTVTCAP